MGKLSEYIQEQAKKKGKTPESWLQGVLENFSKCTLATHVGKFSNPDSRVIIYDESEMQADGLVTTASCSHEVDIYYSSAAYMAAAKLLLLPLEDGKSCLEHLQSGGSDVYEEFKSFGVEPERLHTALSGIQKASPGATDGNLRQVYFPVGKNQYHLLTVLPASSLLETMGSIVREMKPLANWFETNHKKGDIYGEPSSHLGNLTMIGFGGAYPQDISSTLNANSGGKAFLLYSMPPIISQHHIRLPKRDFFRECIPYAVSLDIIRKLHKLFKMDRNNIKIREKIRHCLEEAADYCIETASFMQMEPEGWSHGEKYQNLSLTQRIWLDNEYTTEKNDVSLYKEIGQQFGRWLIRQYRQVEKNNRVTLGDGELQMFSEIMENSLRREANMTL